MFSIQHKYSTKSEINVVIIIAIYCTVFELNFINGGGGDSIIKWEWRGEV